MIHFPMFVNLNNQPVLVIGGGMVALRKIEKLRPYGPHITVISPEIHPDIMRIPGLYLQKRPFEKNDLNDTLAMVIASSNDSQLNQRIAAICREKKIPVNVVDDPQKCSFLFPALIQKGDLSAGISTGGSCPTAAIYFKERFHELIPENMNEILEWLENKRIKIKKEIPQQAKRAGVFRRLFDACLDKQRPLTEEETLTYMNDNKIGSVALVGAGCGKADLITVRGLRLLQQCEAVVYDDLIDPELLDAVPEAALRIYMGKRSGAHSAPQEEINQKLIELAKSGLKVVRLKGGDPYLFGRGGEEMLALLEAGISCQEVPGIPSAIGIAAEAGIPVTHRGASRGLHIITAHTSDTEDKLPDDFDNLACLSGTLVFLMGLKQLPKIAERLIAAGKSAETPAAVISGGNSPNPAKVRAPLSQIVQAVKNANVSSPAIIIVGDVTALDLNMHSIQNLQTSITDDMENTSPKPLCNVKIGITGTEEIAGKQQVLFTEAGAESCWISRSAVKAIPFNLDMETLSSAPCWLVFTSANGVKIFLKQLETQNISIDTLKNIQNLKFAVIGSATGAILENHGIKVTLCPDTFTSEELAIALAKVAKPKEKILLLRSSIGSAILPEILMKAGLQVQEIPTYYLETIHEKEANLSELDYLTFSSASGVDLFFSRYDQIPEGVTPVCIGAITSKALSKYTKHYLLAKEITVNGILQTIIEYDKAKK